MQTTKTQLVRDQSSAPIQVGGYIQTVDGDGNVSPFTLSAGINPIQIPLGGMEFIVEPVTNDLQISEDPFMNSYDVVSKGTKEAIPCSRMKFVYIQGNASDVITFRFTIV